MRIDRRLLQLAFGGLFWRTFLLIALLISVSLAAWFQSFRVIEREPRAQRVALQLVAIVKLTRTALLYSDPDLRRALLQDLESNEGVRVPAREDRQVQLQPDESLNRLIEHDIRSRLGDDTVIAQSVNDIPGVWISFKIDDDDYWVALDRDQLDNVTGLQWAGGLFALALSLFGSAFITSLVNRPFSRLALAARQIGSGQTPELLPERGMGVAAETNRSFNQMVRDLEQLEADRALMLAGICTTCARRSRGCGSKPRWPRPTRRPRTRWSTTSSRWIASSRPSSTTPARRNASPKPSICRRSRRKSPPACRARMASRSARGSRRAR